MDAERWRAEQRNIREAVRSRRGTADGGPPAPVTVAMPLASVIVVCWNAADVLGRCLDQLFAQDHANYEIVVVDDGSDDNTLQVAERASTRGELTIVRSPRNRGCPHARNLGLRHAKGEIVAFIDADGYAAPSWLRHVVEAFDADATVGGVASTVFFDDEPARDQRRRRDRQPPGVGCRSVDERVLRAGGDRRRGAVSDGLRHGAATLGGGAGRAVRRSHAQLLRRRRLRRAAVARGLPGRGGARRLDRSRLRRRRR